MNTHDTTFEGPEVKNRHDTVASSAVLAAILVSALSGAFVAGVDSAVVLAAEAPAHYAAVEEARP